MRCEQTRWPGLAANNPPVLALENSDLVLVFGARELLADPRISKHIATSYPNALITGCTTAGEICGEAVSEAGLSMTAIDFRRATVEAAVASLEDLGSREAGVALGAELARGDLAHVFILSEGIAVNGSELVRGLESSLPGGVSVTGGLSGDAERFETTEVLWRGQLQRSIVVAIGFYGDGLEVGFGTYGGWQSFGPERTITRSQGSTLHELDGRSALALYKEYLGDFASGLPATGLLFPLSLRERPDESGRVRTILGIDEQAGSLHFASDIPEGAFARLMTANVDRLVEGAAEAARTARNSVSREPELALLVSCFGRKLVLHQRVEEELEAVGEVLGDAVLAGFYSYGEIAPRSSERCELHNQTMTITTLSERA